MDTMKEKEEMLSQNPDWGDILPLFFVGCGCHRGSEAARFLIETLRLTGETDIDLKFEKMNMARKKHGEMAVEIALQLFHHLEYTEHGSSVGGSWILPQGTEVIQIIDRIMEGKQ